MVSKAWFGVPRTGVPTAELILAVIPFSSCRASVLRHDIACNDYGLGHRVTQSSSLAAVARAIEELSVFCPVDGPT